MSVTCPDVSPCSDNNRNIPVHKTQTYRYKFSKEILDCMKPFSKIHAYDNKNTFKEAWDIWMREHADIVQQETTRLTILGYVGDIPLKMYKSVRYYYAKLSDKKKTPNKRRKYISVNRLILNKMNTHIKTNAPDPTYKPSKGFTHFMEENYYEVMKEQEKIQKNHNLNNEDVTDKFKKTYKNQYYIYKKT